MKRLHLFLILLCCLPAGAQTFCGSGPWTQVVDCVHHFKSIGLKTNFGTIDFFMPLLRARDETISATVFMNPAGITDEVRQENLRQLQASYIDWDGDRIIPRSGLLLAKVAYGSSSDGVLCLVSPGETPPSREDRDGSNCRDITAQSLRGWPQPLFASRQPFHADAIHVNSTPFRIEGSFTGDLSNTSVLIDDEKVTILAETQSDILITSPGNLGMHRVTIIESGREVLHAYTRFIGIELAPPSIAQSGSSMEVTLKLTGLENLSERLGVTFTTIDFAPQRATIGKFTGNCVHASGNQWAPFRPKQRIALMISPECISQGGIYAAKFLVSAPKIKFDGPEAVALERYRWPPPAFDISVSQFLSDPAYQQTVRASIREWSNDSGIAVTSEAGQAIEAGFKENHSLEQDFWGSFAIQIPDESELITTLVRSYLYHLRDHPPSPEERPATPGAHFLAIGHAEPTTITEKFFLGLPVKEMLKLWDRLNEKYATLEIKSEPNSHLRITVDGNQGNADRNSTDVFWNFPPVLGSGKYIVTVGSNPDAKFDFAPECFGPHGSVYCTEKGCITSINERCEEWGRAVEKEK